MRTLILLIVLPTVMIICSCTGVQVRDTILLPLAREIYEHLVPQIELGLADAVEDGDLSTEGAEALLVLSDQLREALKSGDRSQALAVDWPTLEAWAVRGVQRLVDDGTISPAVATSLYQRIVNFRDLLAELGVRIVWSGVRPIYSTTETIGGDPVFVGFPPKVRPDPRERLGLR